MSVQIVLPGVSPEHWCHSVLTNVQTIGRNPSSDLHIEDRSVSRKHARIWTSGDHIELVDMGSRNGTWVNSKQVQRATLSPGDQVQFGQDLVFRIDRHDSRKMSSTRQDTEMTSWRSACNAAKSLVSFYRTNSARFDSRSWISLYSLGCAVHGSFERQSDRTAVGGSILAWLQDRVNLSCALMLQHNGRRWHVSDHRTTTGDTSAFEYDTELVDQCRYDHPLVLGESNDLPTTSESSNGEPSSVAWKGDFAMQSPSDKYPRIVFGKIGHPCKNDLPRCKLWLQFASFLCQKAQSCIDHEKLTPAQIEILGVIRESSSRLTTNQILQRIDQQRFDRCVSIGVTKQYLAELVKRGILNNKRPGGYGFPGWK